MQKIKGAISNTEMASFAADLMDLGEKHGFDIYKTIVAASIFAEVAGEKAGIKKQVIISEEEESH